MTDPLGQSQVIPYLAALTKEGYAFTILSCDKPEAYAKHGAFIKNLLAQMKINWISLPYHRRPPVVSSMLDLWQMKRTVRKLMKTVHFDMVHTRPGIPTLVALWMKKKYGTRFLNDIRGFWADERVDGGMWNLKNPLFKKIYTFFKKNELDCIVKADANNCLTEAARKEIHSWKYIPGQPIPLEVIPCSVDLNLFDPAKVDNASKDKWRSTLGIEDGDVVISYLGSIGGWYLTAEMIRFCARVHLRLPQAKFLFISPHRHEVILAAAANENLPASCIITVKAQRAEVPSLLVLSSYSLFFIRPCYSKISSSPTKHGEIMAMGIPVVTNGGVGDVADIVEKYEAGYVVPDFSDNAYDAIIEQMISGRKFDATRIRQGARDVYSLNNAVDIYKRLYKGIPG